MATCLAFLKDIQEMNAVYQIKEQNRSYWKKFSKAYRVLYEDGHTYLPEILDSAQEAFPFLWVNGEKYVFSDEVIDCG